MKQASQSAARGRPGYPERLNRKEACVFYVGLDVHTNRSSLEILDNEGKRVKRLDVSGPWADLERAVAQIPTPSSVCYEASCGYGHLHDRLAKSAARVVVAHPAHLRLIYRSKRKNDRVDAAKLARLLFLDAVPAVHVPRPEARAWRSMIEFRQKLVARRTGVKNQLRALLRARAIQAVKHLWNKSGVAWLAALTGLDDLAALQRDLLVEELAELDAKVARVEQELAKVAARHPAVGLLRTIPGVGPRTAEAVVAYVDDVARFARSSQLGVYFGLVPCQDASADRNRLGHVTCEGPATVRKLLCESAWQAARHSPRVRGWFERVAGGDRDRRKVAIVAVARKLVVVMGAMLRSGEAWREEG
jgi:transposase